jgi:chromosome segregation ATPase
MTDLEKTVRANIEREIAATENQMRHADESIQGIYCEFDKLAERLGNCKTRIAGLRERRQRLIQSLEARTE